MSNKGSACLMRPTKLKTDALWCALPIHKSLLIPQGTGLKSLIRDLPRLQFTELFKND
jgi:hypothetical protein